MSVLNRLNKLAKSGSLVIDIQSTADGGWFIMLAQQFSAWDEAVYTDEVQDLEKGLTEAIDFHEDARRRRNIKPVKS